MATEITVSKTVQVHVSLNLSGFDAEELVYFLKTACSPPRIPDARGPSNIIRHLADAISEGMK